MMNAFTECVAEPMAKAIGIHANMIASRSSAFRVWAFTLTSLRGRSGNSGVT